VALVNPAYVMVNAGRVLAVNGQGTTVLSAGSTWFIANSSSVPAAIATNFIPPLASSSLNNLSAVTSSSPQGGSMAGFEGGGVPAQQMNQWLILGLIAAALIVVVAAQDGDSQTTPQH
jgi:hypothetical protein